MYHCETCRTLLNCRFSQNERWLAENWKNVTLKWRLHVCPEKKLMTGSIFTRRNMETKSCKIFRIMNHCETCRTLLNCRFTAKTKDGWQRFTAKTKDGWQKTGKT